MKALKLDFTNVTLNIEFILLLFTFIKLLTIRVTLFSNVSLEILILQHINNNRNNNDSHRILLSKKSFDLLITRLFIVGFVGAPFRKRVAPEKKK